MDARVLTTALTDPASVERLTPDKWTALLTIARAEQLLGSLAHRLAGLHLPATIDSILADARAATEHGRTAALWEAEMARRALAPIAVTPILLKGTAYVAAGLDAGQGRSIGDLDILVPRDRLEETERALLAAGWEWVKPDPYDDAYYRRWMHELPPLIHRERDRMIDVHHTILPLTARRTPQAAALIDGALPLGNGMSVLSPEDMIVHAAIHLFADGDLAGGLRNLWDIDRLLREFGDDDPAFSMRLRERSRLHEAEDVVDRAVRNAVALYETPFSGEFGIPDLLDLLIRRRLLARDGWGRLTRSATRLGFYVRSHWLRMPPAMLARHLLTKVRARRA